MGTPRDYYTDLELPPTADVQEIRKQFRKLALKYHPDRNPGREQEVNSKFQIIQSAHEVLTDPEQKAKYDATRTKSRYPTASGVKGNPWANAGSQFPPPPRRNASSRTQPPPSGAQRWQTRFSSGVPPTAKQATSVDPEAKKNAARAFENMRKGHPSSRPPPPPPPPRTESARQRAQASFGSRKAGYQPRSAMPGDEPPVASANYTTRPDADRHAYAYNPQQPSQSHPTMPDPLSQFRDQDPAMDFRKSAPYSRQTGEKTNLFDGTPLARAKSTRDATRHGEASSSDDGPSPRQRSASVPEDGTSDGSPSTPRKARDQQNQPQNTAGMTPDSRPKFPMKKTRNVPPQFKSDFSFNGTSSPNTVPPKESTTTDEDASANPNNGTNGPPIFSFPLKDDVNTFARASPDMHQFTRRSTDDINTSFVNGTPSTGSWQFSAGGDESKPMSPSQAANQTGRDSPSKRPPPSRTETPGSLSESGVSDAAFNPDGWGDKFGPQTFVPQRSQTNSASPSKGGRAASKKPRPTKQTAGNTIIIDDSSSGDEVLEWRGRKPQAEPVVAESPQAMDIDSPPPADPAPPSSGFPSAPSPSPEVNTARKINVEPTRPEWRPGNVEGLGGDTKPEEQKPVEADEGAPKPTEAQAPEAPGFDNKEAEAETTVNKVPEPLKPTVHPTNIGSEDSEEFRATLADLKNVAPFVQQPSGLKSFVDLKDTLPFESKAASDISVKLPKAPPLVFPTVPLAPRLPAAFYVNGLTPSQSSWDKYEKDFEVYLQQWDTFNALVVDHFATRKNNIKSSRESRGYSFLRSRNEHELQEYYSWVQQDIDVRKRWGEACENHRERLRDFMAFRQRMN